MEVTKDAAAIGERRHGIISRTSADTAGSRNRQAL
jgi:hypothetical protein